MIIASNRDEFYERAGDKPALHEGENYQYFSPLDPRCGGSWLGMNSEGLFAAVVNRPDEAKKDDAPSRGLLVTDILGRAGTCGEAIEIAEKIKLDNYPYFSLLVLAPQGVFCLEHSPEGPTKTGQEIGSFFLSDSNKCELYTFERWSRFPWGSYGIEAKPERLRGRLQNFCRQHRGFGGHDAMCRHGEEAGTLSSNIIIVDLARQRFMNDYSSGAPCETTYNSIEIPREFEKSVLDRWAQHSLCEEYNIE